MTARATTRLSRKGLTMDVVSAKFKETTDSDVDWISGVRRFECDANGAEDVKCYVLKQYDSTVQALGEFLTAQWVAHGRIYRASFGLGLVCDFLGAEITYDNATVRLCLPAAHGCKPKEVCYA